ncbi:energy-coupling factor transporter transmembrane protein EcfT [Sulfitobacter albidus]|uniref:Energy-coupling factor transporter transmembrane protein EcfT n=1 Tax=Sulfitobacter albidus TaxID=2829501 RepID=A0A975PLL2_9RHOB|nr:energy-coupling factor transporter transmembrane protein EcfT [Sulfitobacter albidus]QUJ75843.1 energy-coupling factor transporter transmembrane protein EcfT [Sulfitobacter albidus]
MISLTSPVRTRAHDWPAGAKLLALCVATIALFAVKDPWVLALAAAGVAALYAVPGRVFLRHGAARLRPLWPFVALVLAWHGLTGDLPGGLAIVLRMGAAVALANLVTMTTSLTEMRALLARGLAPLARLGVNTRAVELAVVMVIRFTPVMAQHGATLAEGWRARSRRRPGWRIIVPLMVRALDDADDVAEALRARGGAD